MQNIQQIVPAIRGRRKELGVPEKEFVPVIVAAIVPILNILRKDPEIIEKLAKVEQLKLISLDERNNGEQYAKLAWQAISTTEFAVIYEKPIDLPAERDRLTKDIARYEKGLAAAERQLTNEAFLQKAPPAVVEGLKKQEAETRLLLEKARAAFDALPKS
jgi:valyl-tRNA synthetase